MKFERLSLLLAVSLLIAPLGLHIAAKRIETKAVSLLGGRKLAEVLPRTLPGFVSKDEPIADTEEMRRAVGEILNFTDAAFRIYQDVGRRYSVYVAWWEPGRMSPRLVGMHTPDVCWTGGGWKRERGLEALSVKGAFFLNNLGFAEGEERVFVANNKPEYVIFWHKVGPRVLSYRTEWAPPWWAALDEIRRNGLNLRQSQLFVRISSDVPLETFWLDPALEPLRAALLELGLEKPREG